MKSVIGIFAFVLAIASANAQEAMNFDTDNNASFEMNSDTQAASAWACTMAFQGKGHGLKVILGRYRFLGYGILKCTSAKGEHASYKVKITMRTAILSPGLSIGRFEMKGRSAEISLANSSPRAVLGDYYIAQGNGAIRRGVGVITAVKVGNPQLALKLSLQFLKGFGINLSMNKMQISLAE